MDMYTRLVQAGIRPDCAADTIGWFRRQGDDRGLEQYVSQVERRAKKRKECPR